MWTIAALLAPAALLACSVPVFRYALDHWQPDSYQALLYHEGPLSEQDLELFHSVRDQWSARGANIELRTVDLAEPLEPLALHRFERATAKAQNALSLPAMVLHMPFTVAGHEMPVGYGPWDAEEMERVVSSPARQEIAARLLRGEVVWVYLDGQDSDDDTRRFSQLQTELEKLGQTLELPPIAPEDEKTMTGEPEDLSIRFSALRVTRDDPHEQWLRHMLLSTEADLRDSDLINQAMVFPIFGRGRALYALVGDGIQTELIEEAAKFLTGACQCTVKLENPGVDLLLPIRWGDFVTAAVPKGTDFPLAGPGAWAASAATQAPSHPSQADSPPGHLSQAEPSPAVATFQDRGPPPSWVWWWSTLGLFAAFMIVCGVSLLFRS